ncbi:hypothetical protein [Actinomycetospora termitidis]|uniref:Integral membrane protein n=1 Tax=Actinomycetospora termitidis TaxID=3053470 RepID=A0ABT7M618_9PSEU|nr:hypothetical protein [Actinomycetospora sp. Odt1-22]MDL5156120.1 hypothetical protein [Actinomycetospora sp. Odt1-22]
MTHSTRTTESPDARTAGPTDTILRAVQVTAVLSVLNLAVQFLTAGQMFPRGGPVDVHAAGAIVLHVVTGLLTIAAVLYGRAHRGPWWPAVLAALVFVASFVQAWFGEHTNLAIHVPGALVLTVGTVWVTAWSFTRAVRR